MKKNPLKTKERPATLGNFTGARVGEIIALKPDGSLMIDFSGNPHGPLMARVTDSVRAKFSKQNEIKGKQVLLVFENDDYSLPIVVDTLYSLVDEITANQTLTVEADKPMEALIDGKKVTLNAEEQIELRCGEASILLQKDGQIVIKGTDLLSRSSGLNRVKGAKIDLN